MNGQNGLHLLSYLTNITDLNNVIINLFGEFSQEIDISKSVFSKLLQFVTNNNYLLHNNTIYLQTQGVPQGGNASSILANLYLFNYEHNYKMNNNYTLYRYIDDIIVINNLNNEPINFYPENLTLIKSSSNNYIVNFLDITLKINNNLLEYEIYDKRNDYSFNINKLQLYHTCIHNSIFDNIVINQLIRINRLCMKSNRHKHITDLKNVLKDNGYPLRLVNKLIGSFYFTN